MARPNYEESIAGDAATPADALDPAATDPLIGAVRALTAQVERIADQGADAAVHVTIEQVHEAWESIGQRAEHYRAVELVEALGIVVDA